MDKKRLLMPKLYLDSAAVVWNGNGFSGKESIIKHLEDLPGSHHTVTTLDAQKVPESVTGNKLAYVIQVYGIVKYEIHREQKSFHQNFMIITDEDNKWKIASDCFRLQDAIQKS
ncbi:unnamed protein product [Bemisia tabaci]|uniref:NTF2-related export protein n=2 Tax=Bemisia tabaci TaxID=7038 RepID=A0A9P0A0G2_BEMTA|nr:unnamed protein product [Bemisia tabaci]